MFTPARRLGGGQARPDGHSVNPPEADLPETDLPEAHSGGSRVEEVVDPAPTHTGSPRAKHVRPVAAATRFRTVAVAVTVILGATMASAHYEVESGDTLSEIAHRFDSSVAEIAGANSIRNVDMIRVGQKLAIPGVDQTTTVYVVQSGDTLGTIAQRHRTTVAALVAANDLKNPNVIRPGQSLNVEGAPQSKPPPPANVFHVVANGDTVGGIAAKYGTTSSAIVKANRLANANRIRVGQKLEIPGVTKPSTSEPRISCPVPNAIFINDWGFPRSGRRFHQGTDLFAARGTPVRAPVAGVVEAVTGEVGGLQFWLTGDDGNLYIGTHMERFGQVGRVEAGDVVGAVGDTGNALGAKTHLHFEILVSGKSVPPYPYLVAACR